MNYTEALEYLDARAVYEKTGTIEAPSLDSIRNISPQLAVFRRICHFPR